jgi:Mg2+/citrate symporter
MLANNTTVFLFLCVVGECACEDFCGRPLVLLLLLLVYLDGILVVNPWATTPRRANTTSKRGKGTVRNDMVIIMVVVVVVVVVVRAM